MTTSVLLTDQEPTTRGFLERHLALSGFELIGSAEQRPDVVVAGTDRDLARWRGEAPVIVLGRQDAEVDERLRAFRLGCDDYVTRPFHYDELVERIRAVVRLTRPEDAVRLVAGPLELDARARVVLLHGTPVPVSRREYALLRRLAVEPTRTFTRAELLREIWEYHATARTRALDVVVSRLRRKLRLYAPEDELLETVWGVGYRLLGELPGLGGTR